MIEENELLNMGWRKAYRGKRADIQDRLNAVTELLSGLDRAIEDAEPRLSVVDPSQPEYRSLRGMLSSLKARRHKGGKMQLMLERELSRRGEAKHEAE